MSKKKNYFACDEVSEEVVGVCNLLAAGGR